MTPPVAFNVSRETIYENNGISMLFVKKTLLKRQLKTDKKAK